MTKENRINYVMTVGEGFLNAHVTLLFSTQRCGIIENLIYTQ